MNQIPPNNLPPQSPENQLNPENNPEQNEAQTTQNQEPELDLNILDAKLTELPNVEKVNQILDNAINQETSDTLESGLFLHVAENMLDALFKVDPKVFTSQIAQQAEIRKRLQLLISKLSGSQTSIEDIQELKLKLAEVLFSHNEIQVPELKDFAKKFKLKFNQLINNLVLSHDFSMEQLSALDSYRERFKEQGGIDFNLMRDFLKDKKIDLKTYFVITGDQSVLGLYPELKEPFQVTKEFYQRFQVSPNFCKYSQENFSTNQMEYFIVPSSYQHEILYLDLIEDDILTILPFDFNFKNILELSSTNLKTLNINIPNLEIPNFSENLAKIFNNNPKLEKIFIGNKEYNLQELDLSHFDQEEFLDFFTSLDPERLVYSKENSELKSKDIHPDKLLELYLNKKIQNFYMDENKFKLNIHGQMLEIFNQAESINISQLNSDDLLIFFELPSLKSIGLNAHQFSKLSESEWFISENVNRYDFKVTDPENLTYEILKKYQKERKLLKSIKSAKIDPKTEESTSQHEIKEFNILDTLASLIPQNYSLERPASKIQIPSLSLSEITPENQKVLSLMQIEHLNIIKDPEKTLDQQIQEILAIPNMQVSNLFLQGFKLSTDGGEITPLDIFNLSKKFPNVNKILLLESIPTPAKIPIQEFRNIGIKSDEELKENFLGYERKTLSAKKLKEALDDSQIKNLLDFNLPISFANIQFINGVPQLKLEDLKIPNLVQDIAKFKIPDIVIHAQDSSQRSAIIERFFDQEFNLPNHINEIQVYYAKEKDIATNYSKADLIINQIVNLDNLADIQKLILNNLEDFKQRASSFALPPELKIPQGFKVAPQLTEYFLDLSSYHITNTFNDIEFQLTSDNLADFQNIPSPRLNFYLHSSFGFNEYTVAKIFENNPKTDEIKIGDFIYDRKSQNDLNLQNLLNKPDSKLETIYDTTVSLKVSDKNINQFLNLKFKNLENLELKGFEDLSQENKDKLLNFLAFSLPVSIQRVVVHKLLTTNISKQYGEGFFAKIIINNPNLKYFASQEISKIVEKVLFKASSHAEGQQQAYRFIRLFQQANKKIPYPSKSVFKEFNNLEFIDRNHASIFYQFLEQLDSPIYIARNVINSMNKVLGFSSANALPLTKVERFEIPKRLEISYEDFINNNFLINKKEDIDTIYNNTHIVITDQELDRINTGDVKNLSFPYLKECQSIYVNSIENLTFPSLESCEKVNINNVENLELQNLEFAQKISLNNCSNVNLESLKEADEISISNAKEVNLYNLSKVGILNISNLRNLETPSLKYITSANLKNVNTFSAQILSNFASEIIAPDTTTINLPSLRQAEFLDFSEASTLNLNTNIEILKSIIVKTKELKDKLKTSENIKDYQIQVAVRKLTPIEILPEGEFEGNILEYISSPANYENVTITDKKLDDGILNMMFANFKGTLNLPHLESYTGSILIHSAKELNLPNLIFLKGSLEFNGGNLNLPALQLAQKLNIKNIETFKAPSLLSIFDLTTINVENIELPHLLNAENISCLGILNEVNRFNAPNLFDALYINLDAKNINLNSLISVQAIKAKNCEDLNLPSLKYIDSINDSLNYTDSLRLAGTQKYSELKDEEYYSIRDSLLREYRVNPQDFRNTMNTETVPQNPSPVPIYERWDETQTIEYKMLQKREERKKYEEYLSFEEDLSFEDQFDLIIIPKESSFSRKSLDAVKPKQIKIESSNFTFSRISNSDFQNIGFKATDLRGASIQNSLFNQINFEGCDLRNAKFEKTNLQGTKFRNTKLEYISFKNCNLSRAVFGNASLEGANFEGSNLSNVDLSNCNLSEARLVDLTGAPEKLPAGYSTVSRTAHYQNGSTITLYTVVGPNLNLKGANLSESNLEGLDLTGANLQGANLSSANLKDVNLKDANLKGVDLMRANLQGANLESVQLINTEIRGARLVDLQNPPLNLPKNFKSIQVNLEGENVAYTIVGSLDLQEAFLEGADLSNLYLRSAIMQETFLLNANLSDSDLENANLQGANLQRANLQGSNLQNADLTGANLQGANLSSANLQNAKLINLRGVPMEENLPDGYEIQANENGTFDIQLIQVEPELPPIDSEENLSNPDENPNDELSIEDLVFDFQGKLDQNDQDLEPAQQANSTETPSQAEDQVEPPAEIPTPELSLEAVPTLEPVEQLNQNIDLELPSQNIHQVSDSDILHEEPFEQSQEPLEATSDQAQMSFTELRIQRLQVSRDVQNKDQEELLTKNKEHWQRLSDLLQNSDLTEDEKQDIQTQIQESCQKSLARQIFRIGLDERKKRTEIRSSQINLLIRSYRNEAFEGADFSGLDLSYLYFSEKIFNKANLQGANLQGADLDGSLMHSVNFENANLSYANLNDTDLSNTNFKKANLEGANFSNANLSGADLSEAKLDRAIFTNVIIDSETKLPNGYTIENNQIFSKKLRLIKYNFENQKLTSFDLKGVDLTEANLQGADLQGLDLRKTNLRGAKLSGANLQGANLKGADLSNADLSETDLSSVKLTQLDMIGIRLVDLIAPPKNIPNGYNVIPRLKNGKTTYTVVGPNVNLMYADLSNAELNRTDLSGSNLNGADLSGAYFYDADLTNANLSDTNLSGAHLSEANLTNANLSGADLSVAHLGRSILTGTDLSRANLNRTFVNNTDFSQAILDDAILNQVFISTKDQSTLKLPDGWILEQDSDNVYATIRMRSPY